MLLELIACTPLSSHVGLFIVIVSSLQSVSPSRLRVASAHTECVPGAQQTFECSLRRFSHSSKGLTVEFFFLIKKNFTSCQKQVFL